VLAETSKLALRCDGSLSSMLEFASWCKDFPTRSRKMTALITRDRNSIAQTAINAAAPLLHTNMSVGSSVILETSLGNIELELYWDHAPRVRIIWCIFPHIQSS
jgi:hypothetical protein